MSETIVDWVDLQILDTHHVAWEPLAGIPGALHKVLERLPNGEFAAMLVYLPPGSPLPNLPHRHRHLRTFEKSFTLWGELPHWEYRDEAQQHGLLTVRRAGAFMSRQPGSIHGLEPGPSSRFGWCAIQWRSGTGNWVGEPDFDTETEDVPYGPGWEPQASEEWVGDDGVVVDWPLTRILDTRDLPWEPLGDALPGALRKVLEVGEDGLPRMQLTYLPAGFTLPDLPYRHRHKTVHEFAYTLWGELPHWEYESEAQAQGVNAVRRAGTFMHRLPGSIHGLEPGPVSPTGCVSLGWRTGIGTWIGEPGFDTETEHVPYPPRAAQ